MRNPFWPGEGTSLLAVSTLIRATFVCGCGKPVAGASRWFGAADGNALCFSECNNFRLTGSRINFISLLLLVSTLLVQTLLVPILPLPSPGLPAIAAGVKARGEPKWSVAGIRCKVVAGQSLAV
jgi:hypothetical protein